MGSATDVSELLAPGNEKRARAIWSIVTVLGTMFLTTGTVSWKMSRYVADLERSNEVLRGEIRVIAKDLENFKEATKEERKELRAELHDARERADNALLLAQLTRKGVP
jgi:hypothetical protein